MSKGLRFGVIAEDKTDVDAVAVLVRRIVNAAMDSIDGKVVGIKYRNGKGCANMRRKAPVWIKQLIDEECAGVVLVHDLDRDGRTNVLRDEDSLRSELQAICSKAKRSVLICIPVEELEAWFFACAKVMKAISGKDGQEHASPHSIARPKERLMALSCREKRKPLYSTNDNAKYAAILDLDACAASCEAFSELRAFVATLTSH